MDPLPLVNKTYNMVQKVEKQKRLTCYKIEPTAFFSAQNNNNTRKEFRKPKNSTQKKFCEYCILEGHTMETCFERVGYPDWWKGPRKTNTSSKPNRSTRHANMVQERDLTSPLEEPGDQTPSSLHPVDLFTKSLSPLQHASLSSKLGLVQLKGGCRHLSQFWASTIHFRHQQFIAWFTSFCIHRSRFHIRNEEKDFVQYTQMWNHFLYRFCSLPV